ncbi:MAG: DUF721 domain-containing protein [bacterium]
MRGYLRDSGLGPQLKDARVFQAWTAVLGEPLASRAVPVRFLFGELTVEVESSPHLHELQNFTGDTYRQAANQRLGDDRIKKLTFHLKR